MNCNEDSPGDRHDQGQIESVRIVDCALDLPGGYYLSKISNIELPCLASSAEQQQSTSRRHNNHHRPHIGTNRVSAVGAAVESVAVGGNLIAELGYA